MSMGADPEVIDVVVRAARRRRPHATSPPDLGPWTRDSPFCRAAHGERGGRHEEGRRLRAALARRCRREPRHVHHRLGRGHGCQPRRGDRAAGHDHPRSSQLRRLGALLAGQRRRAVRHVHQRRREVRRDVVAPDPRVVVGSTAVDGSLVEQVRELKARSGGDIGVHASISVAASLLAAGVVDELRLVIAPNLAGRGRRLLDLPHPISLELTESEISPSGALLLAYRVLLELIGRSSTCQRSGRHERQRHMCAPSLYVPSGQLRLSRGSGWWVYCPDPLGETRAKQRRGSANDHADAHDVEGPRGAGARATGDCCRRSAGAAGPRHRTPALAAKALEHRVVGVMHASDAAGYRAGVRVPRVVGAVG